MLESPRHRVLVALTLMLAGVALLPPLVAVAASFDDSSSEGWTTGGYRYVWETYGGTLLVSLKLAALVVSGSLLLAVPAAYGLVRHPFPGSRGILALATTPLSLPGITIAIAALMAWGGFRGSLLLLAGAQMLYTVPYVLRVVTGALSQIPLTELHDAASTLGASRAARVVRITLPLLAQPIAVAALLVFSVSWGEFNVAFMLATPQQSAFPAALYGTYTSNSAAVSGAATAIFLAGAIPFLVAMHKLSNAGGEYGQGA